MFEFGRSVTLHYPRRNAVNEPLEFVPRRIVVREVRDLVHQPLTPFEVQRRPYLFRGRYLVRGVCDDGKWRQFYPASSLEFWQPTPLKIGLYVPGQPTPVDQIDIEFGWNRADRHELVRCLRELDRSPIPGLLHRVTAIGFRLFAPSVEAEDRLIDAA